MSPVTTRIRHSAVRPGQGHVARKGTEGIQTRTEDVFADAVTARVNTHQESTKMPSNFVSEFIDDTRYEIDT